MTELGVGRLRTAFTLPSALPVGGSTLMPPHSQGAERQMEPRVRRTRWGLRVLLLGALAGAAWLLTGVAAQAADRTGGPTGSLLGSVVGESDASPVSAPPTAAPQPPEAEHHFVAPVVEVPWRVRGVAGPDRLTAGPAITPVTDQPLVPASDLTSGIAARHHDAEAPTVSPD